jgi:hypothetical protein
MLRPLALVLSAASLLAPPALGAEPSSNGPSAQQALAAFQALCLGGDTSPKAVLVRADRAGWSKVRPAGVDSWDVARDRALQVGSTSLLLDAWNIDGRFTHEDSCSIGARVPTTGWAHAMQQWLAVAPSFDLGPTLVFFTVAADHGWRRATVADKATADERHYNFVASDGIWRGEDRPPAVMMVNHFRAAARAR